MTEQGNQEVFEETGVMRESIENKLLEIKLKRQEISKEESEKLSTLKRDKIKELLTILDTFLNQAVSSFKKLSQVNTEQAIYFLDKVIYFNERRLNVMGKQPIYMDIDSFLHIYMRHVEEYKINHHFEHKDNFQWNQDDIFMVIENIIIEIDVEYQEFRKVNLETKYSKYGDQSIYFQGDYYTFHIEASGRISTFHKNRKKYEKY